MSKKFQEAIAAMAARNLRKFIGISCLQPVDKTAALNCVEVLEENADAARAQGALQNNLRETFEALCAMRDTINEHIPLPSLESDLLQGPETSVFCSVVAEAVITALQSARAQGAEVAVKPLVWSEPHGRGPDPLFWEVRTSNQLQNYVIVWEGSGLNHTNHSGPYHLNFVGSFDTIEEAKAAAQADYEQRIRSALITPPAPQPAEITAQQAAKVLLDIYDNGHHPDFHSIVLASAFGSEAYDKGMDRFQGTHAMAKAFLTAIADPSSTELDYLRAKNQPVNAARPQVANDTPPEDFKWAHVETTIIADPSYPKFDLLSAAASPVEAGEA